VAVGQSVGSPGPGLGSKVGKAVGSSVGSNVGLGEDGTAVGDHIVGQVGWTGESVGDIVG